MSKAGTSGESAQKAVSLARSVTRIVRPYERRDSRKLENLIEPVHDPDAFGALRRVAGPDAESDLTAGGSRRGELARCIRDEQHFISRTFQRRRDAPVTLG